MKHFTLWKSFLLLCALVVGSNVWAATTKEGSYSFTTSGCTGWTTDHATSYCGLYGYKSGEFYVQNKSIKDFSDVDFSAVTSPSVTIKVKGLTNSGTNSYTVSLVNSSGTVVGTPVTKSSGLGKGSSSGSAKESTVTLTPVAGATGYKIAFKAKGAIAETSYTLTYTMVSAYTITPESNNESWGTVSLDGNTITATPETGYRVSKTTPYEVRFGSATITQDGNEFLVSADEDCTIRINFEAIPSHTATFMNAGVQVSSDSYDEDSEIDFPANPSDIGDRKFLGWATSEIVTPTAVAPTMYTSATMGEDDITYYAVFATLAGESEATATLTAGTLTNGTTYSDYNLEDDLGNTWAATCNQTDRDNDPYIGLRSSGGSKLTSPEFPENITAISLKVWNGSSSSRSFYFKSVDGTTTYSTVSVAGGEHGVVKNATLTGDFKKFVVTSSDALQIKYIQVTYGATLYIDYCTSSIPANVTSAGYATYVTPTDIDFANTENVTAYKVTAATTSTITMESINAAPKGTPVILKASANTYTLAQASTTPEDIDDNLLLVSDGSLTGASSIASATIYVLGKKGDKVGFGTLAAATTLTAGKAYLLIDTTAGAKDFISFDSETTNIKYIITTSLDKNAPMYNLSGQKVNQNYKGVIIQNGKKFMNK